MLPREQFDAVARQITGGDTRDHAPIIAGLVRWLKPVSCVEVGTDAGGIAIHIARALQENQTEGHPAGKLVCIDDFSLRGQPGFARFWHNVGLAQVGDVVHLAEADSKNPDAWPKQVDFAFIDGDHSLGGCTLDVTEALRRGARCVVVHDVAAWWGPREWLAQFDRHEEGKWDLLRVPFCGGLAILLRREEFPPVVFTREQYPEGHI